MEAERLSPFTTHRWGTVMAADAPVVPVSVDQGKVRAEGQPVYGQLHGPASGR